jgi:Ricin-type beta-trefoil lectin domain-like/Glycosyl hydrolases family 18
MDSLNKSLWGILLLGAVHSVGCGSAVEIEEPTDDIAEDLSGTNLIKVVLSGQCADVSGASTSDGASIIQWPCSGKANQQWTAKSVGTDIYQFVSVNSGKCMEVSGSSTSRGALVVQRTCGSGSNQKWQAVSKGSGQYELHAMNSGLCLDVTGATTTSGAKFEQWTCNGGGNQRFTFSPVSGSTPVAGNFPSRFAAPYVETWNDNNLANIANATGHKFYTLAFIINGGGTCNPTWNGDTSLTGNKYGSYISSLRNLGGDVIVSFGGADGTELGRACGSVSSLQAAYQKVINQFHLTWIDLDIESGAESDSTSVDRRNKALKNLQAANPSLRVSYTLAVDRSGLPSADVNLLKNAKSNGVRVDVVNIMAMDYGPCYSDMGQAAIDAASATRSQLSSIGLSAKVGVTPMIGTNDVPCEKFTTTNSQQLVNYAQANSYIRLLAFWALGSDSNYTNLKIFHTFH